jgi:flagellar hook-associated protein 2
MSSIASLGIGSGLDIETLVSDLVAAERDPINKRLEEQQSAYEAELSAYGRLKGALADFQASTQDLNSLSDFQARAATSGNENLLTATASKTASEGTYSIEVARLAQAHKVGSSMMDGDAVVGGNAGDSLDITVGAATMSLDLSGGMTVAGIRDAINSAENNPGITAALITGDNDQQALILTAATTGYDDRIQLSYGSTDVETTLGMATKNLDAAGVPLSDLQELDAEVVVDGYSVQPGSNQVSDVISGITLNLLGAEAGTKVSLRVVQDNEKVSQAVSAFVDSYNSLAAIIGELGNYDAANGEHGVLLGDTALRNVQTRLQRELTATVRGLSGPANSLSGIGITTSADGSLELDAAKLEQFVRDNPEDLALMFAGEDGVVSRLEGILSSAIGAGGVIDSRTDGIEATLADISEQRETLDRRFESVEQRYLAQFSAMDALVSQLTATSNFLTQQLDNLPGFTIQSE